MPSPEQSNESNPINSLRSFNTALSSGNLTKVDLAELQMYKTLVESLFRPYKVDLKILRALDHIEDLSKVPVNNTFSRASKLKNIKTCLGTDIEDVKKNLSNLPTDILESFIAANQILIKLVITQQNLKAVSSVSYHASQSLTAPPRQPTPTFQLQDVSLLTQGSSPQAIRTAKVY